MREAHDLDVGGCHRLHVHQLTAREHAGGDRQLQGDRRADLAAGDEHAAQLGEQRVLGDLRRRHHLDAAAATVRCAAARCAAARCAAAPRAAASRAAAPRAAAPRAAAPRATRLLPPLRLASQPVRVGVAVAAAGAPESSTTCPFFCARSSMPLSAVPLPKYVLSFGSSSTSFRLKRALPRLMPK